MNFSKTTLSGWGNYPQVSSNVGEPRSNQELRETLEKKELVPRGLGRSYGDQAINSDRNTIILSHYKHFIQFNKETGILECEAGVSLEEIIEVCTPFGWFPMITPGTKFVTIGGAIANDVHGKAHHVDGTFVNCVIDFTILLANGSFVVASRKENSDLFWANFGGLGLLGIIVKATIQLRKIETTYFKQKSIAVKSLDELLANFEKYDHDYNYSLGWVDSLATGKNLGRGVLTLGNPALLKDLPASIKNPLYISKRSKIKLPVYFPAFFLNSVTVYFLNRVINFVQKNASEIGHYEKFFYPLDAINEWNKGYGKRGFIQYQFVIPMHNGRDNIRLILNEISKSGCTPFLNVLKKFGKKQGLLSFPFEGYTFAIDFPVTTQLFPFIKRLDKIILDFGGRIYLGKDALLDKEVFEKMYPELEEWKSIKQKYDPDHIFTSNIGRRLGLSH